MSQPQNGPGTPGPGTTGPGVPPPPDGGRGKGRTIALVVGALVVVGAVVGGLFGFGVIGGDEASYKLSAPKTVAGDYKLKGKPKEGKSGKVFAEDGKGKEIPGFKADGDLTAQYVSGTRQLQVGGAYGTSDDPEGGVDWLFKEMNKKFSSISSSKGTPKAFTPDGFDGDSLKCQSYQVDTMRMNLCIWGDSSSVATVSMLDRTRKLPLAEAAGLASKVRDDVRVEK